MDYAFQLHPIKINLYIFQLVMQLLHLILCNNKGHTDIQNGKKIS